MKNLPRANNEEYGADINTQSDKRTESMLGEGGCIYSRGLNLYIRSQPRFDVGLKKIVMAAKHYDYI